MMMAVFWVVAPCSLVEVYRRFRGACCLNHQSDDHPDDGSATTKKTVSNLQKYFCSRYRNMTFFKNFE
jgi:hypothetical protein